MTPQEVVEYAVWFARKNTGTAADVAARLLEQSPELRGPLEAADEWQRAYFALAKIAQGQLDDCRAALEANRRQAFATAREYEVRLKSRAIAGRRP